MRSAAPQHCTTALEFKMAPRKKSSRGLLGVARDDSDDELGIDDHPWEWVYASSSRSQSPSTAAEPGRESGRKRKREGTAPQRIVGVRSGPFECRIGDCVLLKAEGSNEAWVAIVEEFLESDEDGDKAAKFLWFSTEKEIRNRERKRTDYLSVSIRRLACITCLLLARSSSVGNC